MKTCVGQVVLDKWFPLIVIIVVRLPPPGLHRGPRPRTQAWRARRGLERAPREGAGVAVGGAARRPQAVGGAAARRPQASGGGVLAIGDGAPLRAERRPQAVGDEVLAGAGILGSDDALTDSNKCMECYVFGKSEIYIGILTCYMLSFGKSYFRGKVLGKDDALQAGVDGEAEDVHVELADHVGERRVDAERSLWRYSCCVLLASMNFGVRFNY